MTRPVKPSRVKSCETKPIQAYFRKDYNSDLLNRNGKFITSESIHIGFV